MIIGCGPSGLLAAQACKEVGIKPTIYAPTKKQSQIGGAMYLHEPILSITSELPDDFITIKKIGTAEGYALKVYGDSHHPVSFTQFEEGEFPMWSLKVAYDRLWNLHKGSIVPWEITPTSLRTILARNRLVINTASREKFCTINSHAFTSRRIWIRIGPEMNGRARPSMTYNGNVYYPWYRKSVIDKHTSYEYALQPPGPKEGLHTGIKPISNTCRCWSEAPNLLWAGRFGQWEKGVLTHHVYHQVSYAVQQL